MRSTVRIRSSTLWSSSLSCAAWAFSLSELALVQREANGSLTVRKKGEGGINYVLVSNGQVVTDNLELAHRDEEWLRGELAQGGMGELDDLFIVELDANNRLNIVDQSGNTTGMKIPDPAVHEVTTVTEFKNTVMQSPSLEDFEAHDKQGDAPTL